ncbi:MAG: hypothetical protein LQ340_000386 [Diploschistes diacapsis]|nr:MAG: hypothetical protein LQ340_000386 [Diploschistes diacapsis]
MMRRRSPPRLTGMFQDQELEDHHNYQQPFHHFHPFQHDDNTAHLTSQWLQGHAQSDGYLPFHAGYHPAQQAQTLFTDPGLDHLASAPISLPSYMAAPHGAYFPLPSEQSHLPAKRPDETDSTCRPRLTAEQTARLENLFQQNQRPSTVQKKEYAEILNLSQEKVNNWFQNRRAKSKQQSKSSRQAFELFPISQESLAGGQSLPAPVMVVAEGMQDTQRFGSQATSPTNEAPIFQDEWPETFLLEPIDRTATSHESLLPIAKEPISTTLDASGHDRGIDYMDRSGTLGRSEHWSPPHETEIPIALETRELLLEQSTSLAFQESRRQSNHEHAIAKPDQAVIEDIRFGDSPTQVLKEFPSSYSSSQTSPMSVTASHRFQFGLETRDFVNAELSDNMGDFRIFSPPSNSDNVLPPSALKRRRRPAPLTTSRAFSTSMTSAVSSSPKESLCSLSVRRIKSDGNCLGVSSGRIRKSSPNSTQKSPRRSNFLERSSKSPLRQNFLESSFLANAMPETRDDTDSLNFPGAQPLANELAFGWPTSSPSEVTAPPLSASHTQLSFEDKSYATSPPIPPFLPPRPSFGSWSEQGAPQSAPAYVTAFSNHSPHINPQSDQSVFLFTPQPQHAINSFLSQNACLPGSQAIPDASGMFDIERHLHAIRPLSSGACHSFSARDKCEAPVPLKIEQVHFGKIPHLIPQRTNGNFSFQNHTAKEFAELTK